MALLHGVEGSLTWTKHGSETGTAVYTAIIYKAKFRRQRQMSDATPFAWDVIETLPHPSGWSADLYAYMLGNQHPGSFNAYPATLLFYTSTVLGDRYSGSCWIMSQEVTISAEDVTYIMFSVRGTGRVTESF